MRLNYNDENRVYDFIPLKQGLKPIDFSVIRSTTSVYDFIPLKQGLKQIETVLYTICCSSFMTLFH